jgi:septum formation protein
MTRSSFLGPLPEAPRVILASASKTRRLLLGNAGIVVTCEAADIDEGAVKQTMRAAGASVAAIAESLARQKAARIAERHPDAVVIGADSMIECEGRSFDKPADAARAVAQLLDLAGRTHRLYSAAVAMRGSDILWREVDHAHLTMRAFDHAFAERYVAAIGDAALGSVGAYQLEGLGAQLFARVEGDFFTILGLPLLPLLEFLRGAGLIQR